MKNNITSDGKGNIGIFNGGNPLKDCPANWDEARKWIEAANKEDSDRWEHPVWSFDCGFKLDYDGCLLQISSRFYPLKTHYGGTWDGSVSVMSGSKVVQEKSFDCATLKN